jgi:predicted nuclease of predicted toxin-antitoxin system
MNFLVDAHLPPGLCAVLEGARHDAVHTRQLTVQNRTSDAVINELSVKEQRVVVTKDTDFYHSHVLHGNAS